MDEKKRQHLNDETFKIYYNFLVDYNKVMGKPLTEGKEMELIHSIFNKFRMLLFEETPTEDARQAADGNDSKPYEYVNHPTHYNNYDVEVIDMMERIWGKEDLAKFCKMSAFRYRMRMGTKPDNPIEQDLNKERWYLNKAKELSNK